jgi:D-alanyl-D-alanine carboxypeptidase
MRIPNASRRTPRRAAALRRGCWSALALAVVAVALASTPAAGQGTARGCPAGQVARGDACLSTAVVAKRVKAIVRRTMRAEKLKAVLYGVRVGDRTVAIRAEGESMTGVPARTDMRFRNGAVAISYLGTLALQLQEDGLLDLDAPISRWYPALPNADRVTPRMLLLGTSGYRDYVGYRPFNTAFYDDPFGHWTPPELIRLALARPPACAPGECWTYSHANFVILGEVLSRAAGAPLATLLQRRILRPAGLRHTTSSQTAEIPGPVLHAFTRERGSYEESTFWNPSWTLARGAIQTSTIGDVLRSASVIGSGRLLSPASYRAFTAPATAGLDPWSRDFYYALGIVSDNGWLTQQPSFAGYFGAMGYQPERRIAIAVASTKLEGAESDPNFSAAIYRRIAAYLAPGAAPRG